MAADFDYCLVSSRLNCGELDEVLAEEIGAPSLASRRYEHGGHYSQEEQAQPVKLSDISGIVSQGNEFDYTTMVA